MFTSFSSALSALNADETAISVVGNNLANLNTPGYKDSVVAFRDLVTQSVGTGLGETQVGFGTGQPYTIREFTQGAVETSTGTLDAAIQGDGFFILQGANGGTEYTRTGNFKTDASGDMLTQNGDYVQGWMANPATGVIDTNGPLGNVVVPVGTVKPPVTTTDFSLDLNLDAAGQNGQISGTYSTTMTVYDSLGNSHNLQITFTKDTTANEWDYAVTIPGADVDPKQVTVDPKTNTATLATGTLTFDQNGNLLTNAQKVPAEAGTVATTNIYVPITNLIDGAADMTGPAADKLGLEWQLYTSAGAQRITQYSQTSSVSANAQNGAASATLTQVGLGDGGTILASYSDNTQAVVGQLALASIRNPDSLIAAGNNAYTASANTALPAIGIPGTGGRGDITGGAIEASTVDIAQEFTNLIIYQRAYEANGKVITTVDQMSQDTINLKQ